MAAVQQIVPAMNDAEMRIGTMPAKFEFLLRCCRNLLAGKNQGPVFISDISEADWDGVIALAELHGVLPLLCRSLPQISQSIPNDALHKIRRSENINARRALLLTEELLRVVGHFQQQKISVLPYKGPVLAQLLYSDVTSRQAGDIDMLIRPSDVRRASEALRTLGFQPHLNFSHAQQSWYLKSGYEYTFAGPSGENVLELKWRILPRFYAINFNLEGMFRRSQSLSIGGTLIPTLSAEDLLLVLCVHASKHAWTRLGWLCDIAQFVNSVPLNWQKIEEHAGALRIERIIALNFLLAQQLLKITLPDSVQSYIKKDSEVEQIAENLVLSIRQNTQFDTESLSYFQLMAKTRERRKDRAKFWWRLGTTPGMNEWAALSLPRPLGFLYRGVRLYRLGQKFAFGKLPRQSSLLRSSQPDSSHKLVTF